MFEEKRLGIIPSKQFEVVLANTHPPNTSGTIFCKNGKLLGHKFGDCPKIECKYCHKRGHILDDCSTRLPRPLGYLTKSRNATKIGSSPVSTVASSNDPFPLSLQISDLQDLLKQ